MIIVKFSLKFKWSVESADGELLVAKNEPNSESAGLLHQEPSSSLKKQENDTKLMRVAIGFESKLLS